MPSPATRDRASYLGPWKVAFMPNFLLAYKEPPISVLGTDKAGAPLEPRYLGHCRGPFPTKG